jgi:SAM-dependent methyltransferase
VQPRYQNPIGHSQNFLRSPVLVDRLLDASSIQAGDLVLDLGAGTGQISSRLALRACDVVAVEKNPSLVTYLRSKFAGVRNVQVAPVDAHLYRDVVRLFTAHAPSLADSLVQLIGKRGGRRLAWALGLQDALPTRIPAHGWLDLFEATLAVTGDELRWRVGHSKARLREQQHRLQKLHRTRSRHLRPPPSCSNHRKVDSPV